MYVEGEMCYFLKKLRHPHPNVGKISALFIRKGGQGGGKGDKIRDSHKI